VSLLGAGFHAICLVLVVAGIAKLRAPESAASVLPDARLARLTGIGEMITGTSGLATSSSLPASAVALAYGAFAVVTLRLLRTGRAGRATDCGCFGAASAPVHPIHLAVNLASTALACLVVARPVGEATQPWHEGALTGATFTGLTVALAMIAYLAYTSVPELLSARKAIEVPG